jgi:hypothetical protein
MVTMAYTAFRLEDDDSTPHMLMGHLTNLPLRQSILLESSVASAGEPSAISLHRCRLRCLSRSALAFLSEFASKGNIGFEPGSRGSLSQASRRECILVG